MDKAQEGETEMQVFEITEGQRVYVHSEKSGMTGWGEVVYVYRGMATPLDIQVRLEQPTDLGGTMYRFHRAEIFDGPPLLTMTKEQIAEEQLCLFEF